MADIFVSYARADKVRVAPLVAALEAQGWSVWWDPDITAGQEFDTHISNQIKQCRAMVVVWTPVSVQSRWVRGEARMGADRGVLVPVCFDAPELPIDVRVMHTVDFGGWGEDVQSRPFRDLLRALTALVRDDGEPPVHTLPDSASAASTHTVQSFVAPARADDRGIAGLWNNPRRRWLAVGGLATLLVALLALWLGRAVLPWAAPGPTRVAILPFSVVGQGDDVGAFAAGLTDTLQGVLSGNGTPTVSAADAANLRGPDRDRLARQLGVRLILDGAAQRDGDSLDVRARLDDARLHITLWSAELRGPATQPAALQAQIGARTIAVLNCSSLALRPRSGLADPTALSLLLKACDLFEAQVGLGDDLQALSGLLDTQRELTRQAPDFAAGHSALAKYLAAYRFAFPPDVQPQLAQEARREARKAIAIDPKDADGGLALYLLMPWWDLVGRDKAIMSLPFDRSWPYADIFKGAFLMDVGRLKESQVFIQRAVAANPLSTDMTSDVIMAWNGQTGAARQELERLERLWPGSPLLWVDRTAVYGAIGDWDALDAALADPNLRPRTLTEADAGVLRAAFKALRSRDPALVAHARAALLAGSPSATGSPAGRVMYLAWLGLVDDAFAQAAQMRREDFSQSMNLMFSPQAAAMRRDRRFMGVAARLGLVDYWRTTGHWPDFCAEPGLPYDCKAEAAKVAK